MAYNADNADDAYNAYNAYNADDAYNAWNRNNFMAIHVFIISKEVISQIYL